MNCQALLRNLAFLAITPALFANIALAVPAQPNKQMQAVLDAFAAKGGKPIETLSAEEARKQPTPADAVKDVIAKRKGNAEPEAVAKVEEKILEGSGGKVPARIYTPAGKGPFPVIVYYHGGGFVIATNDTYDASSRALANQTGAIVVAVEYRKAPEHKFPAAHEDAYNAYLWTLKNAVSINGDPTKIAVAGESAGGNLALNVAMLARDHSIQLPVHELLVYPVAGNNLETQSYQVNANAKPLNKAMMVWFFKNYLRQTGDKDDQRLNLVKADLHGLKPATVITAEFDPLLTEGKFLADQLEKQGVKTHYKNFKGVTHEFFGMAAVVDEAKQAQKFAAEDLKKSFK